MHAYTRKYKERQREMLKNMYDLNGATLREMKDLLYPHLSKSRIQTLLSELVSLHLIKKDSFYPTRGRPGQCIYYVSAKGAREIGIERLSGNHRKGRSLTYYYYTHAKKAIRMLVERYNLILYDNPVLARYAIAKWIARQEGKIFKPEHYYLYIPRKPDTVLVTKTKIIILILEHPESSLPYWRAKKRKYLELLSHSASRDIEFVLIFLDDVKSKEKRQQAEAIKVFAHLTVYEKEHLMKRISVIKGSEDKMLLSFEKIRRITFIESYEIPNFFERHVMQNIVHRKGRHISRR